MAKKHLFDLDHEFFKPLWVRTVVTGITAGWAVFEFVAGAPLWAFLFAAISIYCALNFFKRSD